MELIEERTKSILFWISNVLLTYGIGALTLFEQYLSFFEQILSLPTQNEGLLIDDF